MPVERINDTDSRRLVSKLQSFVEWWSPEWFPALTEADRSSGLPPALEWAVRFDPDFFPVGEFIANVCESGEVQCLRSFGDGPNGFIHNSTDNPMVRFEPDEFFSEISLNDLVVGAVLLSCIDHSVNEAWQIHALADENLIWDGSFVHGRLRAWIDDVWVAIETPYEKARILRPPRNAYLD